MILSCYFPVYLSLLFEYQYFFFFIHYSPYGLFIIFLPLFFSFCIHRLPNLLLKLMARFYITFPAYTTLQPLGAMSRRARGEARSVYAVMVVELFFYHALSFCVLCRFLNPIPHIFISFFLVP